MALAKKPYSISHMLPLSDFHKVVLFKSALIAVSTAIDSRKHLIAEVMRLQMRDLLISKQAMWVPYRWAEAEAAAVPDKEGWFRL